MIMSFKFFLCFALVATISAQLAPYQTIQQGVPPFLLDYDLIDHSPVPVFGNLSEAVAASEKTIVALKDAFKLPSLTFGFAVRGKPILERAWGFLDLENSVPATPNSIYRLASVSKSFTSAIIGRLVDQGLVRYSDPLSLYLKPNIYPPKTWSGHPVNITLSQLLSHTAGEHLTDVADFSTYVPGINCTQMIHKFANTSLRFKPGSSYTYSNYGYQLLGAVIESVTKKPYQEVVREFFRQHNLTSSYVETSELIIHNKARYYMAVNATDRKNLTNIPATIIDEIWTHEGYWSSGGLMSNVPDLLRYGQMLLDTYKGRNSNLVSQKTLKQMWTSRTANLPPNATEFDPGTGYGYGWVISDFKNSTIKAGIKLQHPHLVWHDGSLTGLTTMLILYPEEEAVGVALTNKGGAWQYLQAMVIQTMENVYKFVK